MQMLPMPAISVAGVAGSAAPLVTLIAGIGSICIGWVIVLFARRFTGAGAIYDYVRKASSGEMGVFAAGVYFIGAMFLGGAGIYLAIGFFAQMFFAGLGINLPWSVWALLSIALVFAFNHFGVQTTTRTQLILTALAVLPIIIIALAIIFQGGAAGNTLETFNPGNPNTGDLFRGGPSCKTIDCKTVHGADRKVPANRFPTICDREGPYLWEYRWKALSSRLENGLDIGLRWQLSNWICRGVRRHRLGDGLSSWRT